MRIAFLHLSDIHFEAKDKECNGRADRIVSALRTLGNFSALFIIVSGDVAYSGDINQYRTAKKFFGRLGDLCKKTYNLAQFPRFLFVPGNHDVRLSSDPAFLSKVQKAYQENNVESLYAGEMKKQDNFFEFAKEFDCPFTAASSVLRKSYQLEGFSVEFVLINSAAFSMFEQEKGLHFLPEDDLENACLASKADFVFYVMHHSYHWFNDEQKSRLEDEILRNANVLFIGHEHHPGNQDITHNEHGKTIILAGGMLANKGDWFSSDFAAYTLDTDATEMNWSGYSFNWKKRSKLYVESRGNNAMIECRKTIDSEILPIKSEFLRNLMHDDKLTEDFSLDQYFVFPRLEKRDSDYAAPEECSTMNDFLRLLDKERKIVISGPSNSGKTTLLRSVIKQLMDTKMVVYCSSNDVTSGNRNRIIKNIVSEMYGDNQDQYTTFVQLPKEKKVLLLDDSNLINERNRISFLAELESEFGYVIIMRNEFLNLDIQEQIRYTENQK